VVPYIGAPGGDSFRLRPVSFTPHGTNQHGGPIPNGTNGLAFMYGSIDWPALASDKAGKRAADPTGRDDQGDGDKCLCV
jgi:hypothetical protein